MATYYVDFVNGLDANNGLGPDASHASNKPWKTLTKLLGAAGMASGDTAYLSPAGPFREVTTVAMTSAVAETQIIGDYANAQEFKTSGGVTVTPGPVIVTAYLTNDKTAPSATTLLNLDGRDFLTFKNIQFVGGSAIVVTATVATSTNIKFTDCAFLIGNTGTTGAISATAPHNTALDWTIDRCFFYGGGSTIGVLLFTGTMGAVAEYSLGCIVQNCVFAGGVRAGVWIVVSISSSGAFKPGGVTVRNCTFSDQSAMQTNTNHSTSIVSTITNCFIYASASTALTMNVAGGLTEDYNLIVASTPRSNVAAGANSISNGSYAPLLLYGQVSVWGSNPRLFGEPMAGSPLLGFGNDGTQTAYDVRNNPRPAGGSGDPDPAVGALERGNTWGQETTTVRTGSNALSITGPGYQDFYIPVDASATTVTCYLRQDTTYAGTSPKLIALANDEIGVTEQTDTLAVADDTWEQLSVSFTPTAKGIITIRLLSSDTNGGGQAFADDFGVA